MATFVLVHGAWHGGWCWKRVEPLLRAAGHDVYTPTLTGLGERVHLASPETDLMTHIQDVVGVMEYEELQQVVLVGHSYGGIVIAGVADRLTSRVAHLVYFDALVPRDGEGELDLLPDHGAAMLERCRLSGDGWLVPPPGESALIAWAGSAELPWLTRRLTPQPLKTLQGRVRLTNPAAAGIPATYISCEPGHGPPGGFKVESIRRAQAAGWRYRELATGHDAMVTIPRELADLFLEVV